MEATTLEILEIIGILFLLWLGGFLPVIIAMKVVKYHDHPKVDVEARKLSVSDLFLATVAGLLSIVAGSIALVVIIMHIPIPDKIDKSFDRFNDKVTEFFEKKVF